MTSTPAERPNPQKRNIILNRLAKAPWWLLGIIALVTIFIINVMDDATYQNVWREVQQGIWTTMWVTVVGYTIAMIVGLIVALMRRSNNVVVYQLSTLYVEFVRGIPTLVLVYYVVLALTPLTVDLVNGLGDWLLLNDVGMGASLAELRTRDIPNTARAIVGLAISYSAFLSEVFRAGIDGIEQGQREAALSLGMTRWQVMRYIVLPQAFRIVLPPLGNDFIAMLKESSLVSIVGVEDITRQGSTAAQSNFTFFEAYNVVALTYLVLTLSLSAVVKSIEWYLDRGQATDD